MTTALDTRFRALADRMINAYGASAVLVRRVDTFSEVTNMPTPGTPANYSIKISPPVSPGIKEVDGERVLQSDWFFTTPAANSSGTDIAGLPPNTDTDTITFGSESYRIVAFSPVYSGDLIAAYRIQMRR